MFDLGDYVTIKIWIEYIIPVVIFILFFGILFIRGFAEDRRLHKNVELLEKYGYTKSTHLSYRFGGGGVGKPTTIWTKYNMKTRIFIVYCCVPEGTPVDRPQGGWWDGTDDGGLTTNKSGFELTPPWTDSDNSVPGKTGKISYLSSGLCKNY